MDTGYEDMMYRQVEKSLSNNINDKLFVPIELAEKPNYKEHVNKHIEDESVNNAINEYKDERPRLSRAEYILQAREACLRQMNTFNTTSRLSDMYVVDEKPGKSSYRSNKRNEMDRLFYDGSEAEDLPDEIASYKSLIIRTVCAVVIFISIFIIDKVKLDWGAFSYESIRQYVTGNNQLKVLEDILVSWLK